MYVCLCNAVTDNQIREAVAQGTCTYKELRKNLGIAGQCGKCGKCAKKILNQALAESVEANPNLKVA